MLSVQNLLSNSYYYFIQKGEQFCSPFLFVNCIMSNEFRLDKSAFTASSAKEADNHISYWRTKTITERLQAGFYLINQFYNTTNATSLDRTVFTKRKRS